jgi:hypothetical protein
MLAEVDITARDRASVWVATASAVRNLGQTALVNSTDAQHLDTIPTWPALGFSVIAVISRAVVRLAYEVDG